jgi:hypothetical protein
MIVGACASLCLAACEQSVKEQEIKAEQAQRRRRQGSQGAEGSQRKGHEGPERGRRKRPRRPPPKPGNDMAKGQAKANEEIRAANQDMVNSALTFR